MTDKEETRTPGLHITIRLDAVRRHYDVQRMRQVTEAETLCDVTDQQFSPFVMASFLRALADEIRPAVKEF